MKWSFLSILAAFVLSFAPLVPLWWTEVELSKPRDRPPWAALARDAARTGRDSFAPFAAGVLTAHLAGLDEYRLTVLSVAFVGSRVVYIGVTLAGSESLRIATWTVGMLAIAGLYLLPWVMA